MIPDFQSLMLPLLKKLSDKKEHSFRNLIEEMATEFKLTDVERKEILKKGAQPIFQNHVCWAKRYLKKAILIESPKRAYSKITASGLGAFKEKPDSNNIAYNKILFYI